MEVEICNFEHFSHFQTELTGLLTLVTGDNGVGKTTLLRAIFFCLYGKIIKEDRKLSRETRTESWVAIKMEEIWVRRQRNPGRLQVEIDGLQLEDTAAQAEIDRIFQDREMFRAIFYVPQDRLCALLTATPVEQEQILTALAFRNQDPDPIILAIGDELRKCKRELSQSEAAYNSQLRTFERLTQGLKILKTTPEKLHEVQADLAKIEEDLPKWKHRAALHQKNLGQEQAWQAELSSLGIPSEVSEAELTVLAEKLSQAEIQLEAYRDQQRLLKELDRFPEVSPVDPEELQTLSEKIAQLQRVVNLRKTRAQLLEELEKLPEVEEPPDRSPAEIRQLRTAIRNHQQGLEICADFGVKYDSEQIQKTLGEIRQKLDKLQAYREFSQAWKAFESLPKPEKTPEELQVHREELENLQSSLQEQIRELKSAQGKYKCPSCGVNLALVQQQLVESQPEVDPNRIVQLQQQLQGIPRQLRQLERQAQQWAVVQAAEANLPPKVDPVQMTPEIEEDLRVALDELPRVQVLEDPGVDLEKESQDRQTFFQRRMKLEQLSELPNPGEVSGNLQELQSRQRQLQEQQARFQQSAKHRPGLLKQLAQLGDPQPITAGEVQKLRQQQQQLGQQRKEFLRVSSRRVELQQCLADLKLYPEAAEELRLLEEDLATSQAWVRRAEASLKALKEQQLLDSEADRLDELESRVKVLETGKEQAINLKASMIEAAIVSLSLHTNEILEKLFRDSITISLTMFRQLKSRDAQKRNFHLAISYRGRDYDSFWELSGGERARLSVALSLALASKFRVPLLMMDETLRALDGEIKSRCVEVIRETCPDQLILIVAQQHHVNEADFDQIMAI